MSTPELREPVNPLASPARPLAMLVGLITEDLKQGREAAERAGMPFYRAAGEKTLEAKAQIPHGEFQAWIKRNFRDQQGSGIALYRTLRRAVSSEKLSALNFSSLRDFVRQTSNPSKPHIARVSPPGWQDAIKEKIERARQRAERFQQGLSPGDRVPHILLESRVYSLKICDQRCNKTFTTQSARSCRTDGADQCPKLR